MMVMLSGCGGGTTPTKDGYKLGIQFELTGEVADYGNAELEGAKLAIKLANEKLGEEKYVPVIYDNTSSTTEAVTLATKLVQDGVVGVVGPATSGASAATYQISNDSGVVVVSPSATANNVTLTNPDDKNSPAYEYVFRTCFEDSYQGAAMAQYAYVVLGIRRVVVYGDSITDYAKGLAVSFTEQFEKLGGSVIANEYYVAKDTDFSPVLTRIKDLNLDAIYIPGYYQEVGLIIKQAREMGLDCPIIGGDGFDSETLAELGGAKNLNDVFFTTGYTTVDASPELKAFIETYTKEYGKEPNMFAALAFDATNLLIQACEEAGTNDSAAVRDVMETIHFDGITGSFSFDKTHTPIKSVLVVELVNGVQDKAVAISPDVD